MPSLRGMAELPMSSSEVEQSESEQEDEGDTGAGACGTLEVTDRDGTGGVVDRAGGVAGCATGVVVGDCTVGAFGVEGAMGRWGTG